MTSAKYRPWRERLADVIFARNNEPVVAAHELSAMGCTMRPADVYCHPWFRRTIRPRPHPTLVCLTDKGMAYVTGKRCVIRQVDKAKELTRIRAKALACMVSRRGGEPLASLAAIVGCSVPLLVEAAGAHLSVIGDRAYWFGRHSPLALPRILLVRRVASEVLAAAPRSTASVACLCEHCTCTERLLRRAMSGLAVFRGGYARLNESGHKARWMMRA